MKWRRTRHDNRLTIHPTGTLSGVLVYYKKRYSSAISPWASEQYYDELMKILGCVSHKRVLDVGFGYGEMLARLSAANAETYGVEIAQEAVDHARNNAPHATVSVASAENMPFEDGFFDIVLCSGVVEHLGKLYAGIGEMHRILKGSGFLLAVVPNKNWLGKLYKWAGLNYVSRTLRGLDSNQPIERELGLLGWIHVLNASGFVVDFWRPCNVDLKIPFSNIRFRGIPAALCYHFVMRARPRKYGSQSKDGQTR